jgi:hypothetical protein
MVWVLVVRGQYEIGVWEPLIRMTDGVSLLRSPCRESQGECKKDNIYNNPHHICLKKSFACSGFPMMVLEIRALFLGA